MGRVKSILKGSSHHVQYPQYNRSGQENLNRFIHQHMTMTKPVNTPLEGWDWLRKRWNGSEPNAVIVGSDQVWSPWANVPLDFLGNMYLDFIPTYKGKRIAYAASFGGGEWTYTAEWGMRCADCAKKFDAISVREDSGVRLCKEHLGVDATHVLDPTLLLTGADYEKLLNRPLNKTNTLFAYVLDTSKEKVTFLNKVAARFGLDLKIRGANDDISWDDSIEDWLADIRDAAMVVTDSFHGSVFAIQFHTPFYIIPNFRRGAERMLSLVRLLKIESRIVTVDNLVENMTQNIDWPWIENCLSKERVQSVDFLKNAL